MSQVARFSILIDDYESLFNTMFIPTFISIGY